MANKQFYHDDGNASDVQVIPIENLHLDLENPRLPLNVGKNERDILEYISINTSLEDLMSAIAENGFFYGEPLIAIPLLGSSDNFVVVEGNRRLSAVKILNNISLIEFPSARARSIVAQCTRPPKQLPVVVRKSREDVLPYLGFRHISGVKQWDPLAKARYIYQLFSISDDELSSTERYAEVAKQIGSRRDFIKRNLDALAVYHKIEENDYFGIEGLDEESIKFSLLSTALADERISEFVGINDSPDLVVDSSPINVAAVEELTKWMFKYDEARGGTILGESRNIRKLSQVVHNANARDAIRKGNSLDYAYRLTKGASEEFLEALYTADDLLTAAAGLVANAEYSEMAFSLAKSISNNIKLIGPALKAKKGDDDGF
ncbi:chromosome partitioning protein ParB [Aeromonas veronii]|uniref:ParB N-terminal domain-containing protein n=1 Tax=Aeromonas veronii TaxID=654 RepID=UPI000C284B0D|nr:ParB N-terminal domain-containing protein [Aeromonas veronii]ATY79672.1 chromosome partitioning protein ParB [Aeromonas veronii]